MTEKEGRDEEGRDELANQFFIVLRNHGNSQSPFLCYKRIGSLRTHQTLELSDFV